mgnify:CR=1 FL=1
MAIFESNKGRNMKEEPLGKLMLPYKIQQVLNVIIEKEGLDINEAIGFLYSSNLYQKLSNDFSYLWRLSPFNLFERLMHEK